MFRERSCAAHQRCLAKGPVARRDRGKRCPRRPVEGNVAEHFDAERVDDFAVGIGTVADEDKTKSARRDDRRSIAGREPRAKRMKVGKARSDGEERSIRPRESPKTR